MVENYRKYYRNLFIRVTCKNNNKNNEVYEYHECDIINMIESFLGNNNLYGAKVHFIKHYKDVSPHFHIIIECPKDVTFREVKNSFPYGFIEECRTVEGSKKYLTHDGFKNKLDYYDKSEIIKLTYLKKTTQSKFGYAMCGGVLYEERESID